MQQAASRGIRPSRLALWLGVAALVGGGVALGGAQIYRMYTVKVGSGGQWVEQQMPVDASGKGQAAVQLPEGTAFITRNPDGTVQVELTADADKAKDGSVTTTVTTDAASTTQATPAKPK